MNLSGIQANKSEPAKWLTRQRAFSRIDLLAVIFTVLFLGLWLGVTHWGERGRITRCQANLSALGKAMQGYAHDDNGAIPAAGINLGKLQATWDMKLFPFLKPGLAKANNDELFEIAPRFFACPSDKVPHKKTLRSYAMGGNDMLPEHWPPGRDSATGVGLFWNKQTVLSLLDDAALKTPDTLPALKISSIPVPADTVLVAEFIAPNNTMGSISQVTVSGVSQQQQFFKDGGVGFHHGRFNYLMSDGHVEFLSPLQTGSFDGSSGIWSLKKGD